MSEINRKLNYVTNEMYIEKDVGLPINDIIDGRRVKIIIEATIESIDVSKNIDVKRNWTLLRFVPYSVEVQKIIEPEGTEPNKGW